MRILGGGKLRKRPEVKKRASVADFDKYLDKPQHQVELSQWPQLSRKRLGDDGWLRKWYNGAQIQLTKLDQPGRWFKPRTWGNYLWGWGKFWWTLQARSKAAQGVNHHNRRPSFESYLGTAEEREQIKNAHNSEMPQFSKYVLNPRSYWRFCWDIVLVILLLFTLLLVLFRFAFEFRMFKRRHSSGERGWAFYDTELIYIEYAMDAFFFINWVFMFRTAYFKRIRAGSNDFVLITDPNDILMHHLRTTFFFHMLCGVPWELLHSLFRYWGSGIGLFQYTNSCETNEDLEQAILNCTDYPPPSWTRFPRILMIFQVPSMFMNTRVSGMDRYVQSMREQFALHMGAVRVGKFLLFFYVVMHIIACVLFYFGSDYEEFIVYRESVVGPSSYALLTDFEKQQGKSWITEVKIVISTCIEDELDATLPCHRQSGRVTVLEAPITRQYLMSLYWVATTMTQCGYGDLTPYTQYEVSALLVGMVFGATLYSYIVGNAASLLNDMQGRSALVNEELDLLSRFMVEAGISKSLRSKCLLFFSKHKMSPLTLLGPVTDGLPHDLTAEIKLRIFSKAFYRPDLTMKGRQKFSPLLDGIRRDTLAKLLFTMNLQETVPLETLWVAGDSPPGIAFVLAGALDIIDGEDNTVVATIFPGNHVGENLLIPGEEISPFTVRTKGWCDIIMFRAENLAEALNTSEEDEYWMLAIAKARWSRFLACYRTSKAVKNIWKLPDKWSAGSSHHSGAGHAPRVSSELILRNVVKEVSADRAAAIADGATMTSSEERREEWLSHLIRCGINENGANGKEMLDVARRTFDAGWAVDWSPGFVDDDVGVVNEAQALHDGAFPKANLVVHIQCCKDIRSARVRAISSFNPFCRILVQGRSFETTVKEEETSPYWDETHTFKFEKELIQDTLMKIYVLDHTESGTALIGMTDGVINVESTPGKFHSMNLPLYDEQHSLCGTMFLRYQYQPSSRGTEEDREQRLQVQRQAKLDLADMLSFDPGAQAKKRLMEVLNRVSLRLGEIERKTSLDRDEISRLIAENMMALDSLHALGVGNVLRNKLIDVARLIPAWQSPGSLGRSISKELSLDAKSHLLPVLSQSLSSPGVITRDVSMDPSDQPGLWKQFVSRTIGKPFWYNKYTKETRWTNPALEQPVSDSPFASMQSGTSAATYSSHTGSRSSGANKDKEKSPIKPQGVMVLQDLPPGWVQRLSQRKSLVYYQNMSSGATSWSAPHIESTESSKPNHFTAPETPRAGRDGRGSMPGGIGGKSKRYSAAGAMGVGSVSKRKGGVPEGGLSFRTIPSRVASRPEHEVVESAKEVEPRIGRTHPTVSGTVHLYTMEKQEGDNEAQWTPYLKEELLDPDARATGRMLYREGDARMEYSGGMRVFKREGRGVLKMKDGVTYCGEWADDLPHGFGIEVYTDGSVFKGEYLRDKRHGFGAIFSGDLSYCGGWTDGVRNGSGIETYTKNGETVECILYIDMGVVTMRSKVSSLNQTEFEMLQDMSSRMVSKADKAAKEAQAACDEVEVLEDEFGEMFPESEESVRGREEEDRAYKAKPQQVVTSMGSVASSRHSYI